MSRVSRVSEEWLLRSLDAGGRLVSGFLGDSFFRRTKEVSTDETARCGSHSVGVGVGLVVGISSRT